MRAGARRPPDSGKLETTIIRDKMSGNRIFPRALQPVSVAGLLARSPYIQPSSESNPPESLVFRLTHRRHFGGDASIHSPTAPLGTALGQLRTLHVFATRPQPHGLCFPRTIGLRDPYSDPNQSDSSRAERRRSPGACADRHRQDRRIRSADDRAEPT